MKLLSRAAAPMVLLLLVGTLALGLLAPASAQTVPDITVRIDQVGLKADISLGNNVVLRYNGNVTLTGGIANGVTLEAEVTGQDWTVSIDPSGYIPVAGDTVISFSGTVLVPSSAYDRTYELKVRATVDTPGVYPPSSSSGSMDIMVIRNRVSVEVLPPTTLKVEQSNTTTDYVFSFRIVNRGLTDDRFMFQIAQGLDLRVEGWALEIIGDVEDDLPAEGSVYVNMNISIPAHAPEGMYAISLFVESERTDSSSQATAYVEVTAAIPVGQPHDEAWNFLGLGYFAWSMISLAVIGVCMLVFVGGTEVGYFAFLAWILVPLYCRIMKDKVLDNFTRGEIYGYIKANPGAHYMELQQQLDLPNGVLAHHLMVLEREEFIKIHRDGLFKRFYPRHVKVVVKAKHLSRIQKQLLEEVSRHPGISQKTLASYLQESKQVISYHIKVLGKAGLLRVEKDAGVSKVYATKGPRADVLEEEVQEVEEVPVIEASPTTTGGSPETDGPRHHPGFGRL